jgi:hypothetical protein
MMEEAQSYDVSVKRRDGHESFRGQEGTQLSDSNLGVYLCRHKCAAHVSCDKNPSHQRNTGTQKSAWVIKHRGDGAQLRCYQYTWERTISNAKRFGMGTMRARGSEKNLKGVMR